MMPSCLRTAALAALAVLPAIPRAAWPAQAGIAADGQAVAQLERRWVADLMHGDRADLATILADDYRDVDWRGHVRDKRAVLAGIRHSTDTTQHIEQLDVRTWGDAAVATGINRVHSGKGWTVAVSFTDVFARIDGHWRAVSSQETVRKPSGS